MQVEIYDADGQVAEVFSIHDILADPTKYTDPRYLTELAQLALRQDHDRELVQENALKEKNMADHYYAQLQIARSDRDAAENIIREIPAMVEKHADGAPDALVAAIMERIEAFTGVAFGDHAPGVVNLRHTTDVTEQRLAAAVVATIEKIQTHELGRFYLLGLPEFMRDPSNHRGISDFLTLMRGFAQPAITN